MASSYPKTDLIKNFLSIFLLNHSSNVFRSRHIVFKKVLLNQEYNIILLMGILNMQIQQGFVPPGDETAINWAPEHCAARSRWGSCTVVRCTSWRKRKYWARVPTILMPPTFPIASLNHYTPKFSGGGLKVDLMSSVWPPAPSKVSLSEKLSIILGVFLGQNKFSWPNGQLWPIACHTYSESYCSSG